MSHVRTIKESEVHIWLANCDTIDEEPMKGLLDVDEAKRAGQFREQRDSKLYTVSHGVLRLILSEYLSVKPRVINYERGPYGKPKLTGESRLCFNISHSNAIAAYAISSGNEIGVDIEYICDLPIKEISKDFFSQSEINYLESVRKDMYKSVFFKLWSRKEAFVKAIGKGLYSRLADIDVFFTGGAHQLVYDGTIWSIRDFESGDGYAGAVVVQGDKHDIRMFRY
jgi:4'-phosphopantetheinyl transferase